MPPRIPRQFQPRDQTRSRDQAQEPLINVPRLPLGDGPFPTITLDGGEYSPPDLKRLISQQSEDLMQEMSEGLLTREQYEVRYSELIGKTRTLGEFLAVQLETYGIAPNMPKGTSIFDQEFWDIIQKAPPEQQLRFLFWQDPSDPETNPWRIHRAILDGSYGLNDDSGGGGHKDFMDRLQDGAGDIWGSTIKALNWFPEKSELFIGDMILKDVLPNDEARRIVANQSFSLAFSHFTDKSVARDIVNGYILDTNTADLKKVVPGRTPYENLTAASQNTNWLGMLGDFVGKVAIDPLWLLPPVKGAAGAILFGNRLIKNGWATGKAGGILKGTALGEQSTITVLPRLGRFLAGGPSSSSARQMEKMLNGDMFLRARGELHQTPGILGFLTRRMPQGLNTETLRVTSTSVLEPWLNDAAKGADSLVQFFDDIASSGSRAEAVKKVTANGWTEFAVNPETSRFAASLKAQKLKLFDDDFLDGMKALTDEGLPTEITRRMVLGHVLERHFSMVADQLMGKMPKWYSKVIQPFTAAQKKVFSVLQLSSPRFITLNIGYNGFIGLITLAGKFPSKVVKTFTPFGKVPVSDDIVRNITKVGGDPGVHDQFIANSTFLQDVLGSVDKSGIDLGDASEIVRKTFGDADKAATWGEKLNKAVAFPVYLATNFVDMPTRRLVYGKALDDALHFSEDFLSRGGIIDDLPLELRKSMPDWATDMVVDAVRDAPMTADGVRSAVARVGSELLSNRRLSRVSAQMMKRRYVREVMGLPDDFGAKVTERDFDEAAREVARVMKGAPEMELPEVLDEIATLKDSFFTKANILHEMNGIAPIVSKGPGLEKARVFNLEAIKQQALDVVGHVERLFESGMGGTISKADRGQLLRRLGKYHTDDLMSADRIWRELLEFELDPTDVKRIVAGATTAASRKGGDTDAFVRTALSRARSTGRNKITRQFDQHYAQSIRRLDELSDYVVGRLEKVDFVSARVAREFFRLERGVRQRHVELIGQTQARSVASTTRQGFAEVWEDFGKTISRMYEELAEDRGRLLMGWGPNQPSYNIGRDTIDGTTQMMAFKAHQQEAFLDWVGDLVRKDWDVLSSRKMTELPQLWKDGLDDWAKTVSLSRETQAVGVKISAYERAAFSLTSYERQYGWDAIMQVFAPFEFFPSRILWNWGRRMWDNPAAVGMLWKFARSSDLASENMWRGQAREALTAYGLTEQESNSAVGKMKLPNKFRHQVPVPLPFISQIPGLNNVLPETMGAIGWIDPLAYTNPMEFYTREFYDDERKTSTPLGLATDWVSQNTPFGPSPLWTQIGGASGLLPERQAWTNTIISGGPFGLPSTRAARGVLSFLATGDDLGEMSEEDKSFLINNDYLPDTLLRNVIGLPPGDEWEQYLIDRTMSSLMFTGDMDGQIFSKEERKEWDGLRETSVNVRTETEQERYIELRELRSARAIQSMNDKSGPAYVKARLEASRERGLRDVTGWAGIRISPFLEGDLISRGLKVLHDQAASNGALSEFYDRFPEYQVRNVASSNFDDEDDEGRQVEIDTTLYWFDRNRIDSIYEESDAQLRDARQWLEAMDPTPDIQLQLRDVKAQLTALFTEKEEAYNALEDVYPERTKLQSLNVDPKDKALRDLRTEYYAIELDKSIADESQRWDDLETRQDAFLNAIRPRSSEDSPRDWWDLRVAQLKTRVKFGLSIDQAYERNDFKHAEKLTEEKEMALTGWHEIAAGRVTRYDFELYLNGGWKMPTQTQIDFQKAQAMFDQLMALLSDDSPLTGRQKSGLVDGYLEDPLFNKYFGDKFLDPFESTPEMLNDPAVQRYFAGAPRNQIPAAAIARRREILDHYGQLDRGRPRVDYMRSVLDEYNTIQRVLGLAPITLFEPTPPRPVLPWMNPTDADIDDMATSIVQRGY